MKTVKDMSKITGVSIRTLRYYDEIGLLKPTVSLEKAVLNMLHMRFNIIMGYNVR